MPGKYLNDYEKGQIQGMRDCGMGVTQIAHTMKRSLCTIQRLLKKARELSPGHCPAVKQKNRQAQKGQCTWLISNEDSISEKSKKITQTFENRTSTAIWGC